MFDVRGLQKNQTMITAKITYPKETPRSDTFRFVWGGTWPCWQSPERLKAMKGEGEQKTIDQAAAYDAERADVLKKCADEVRRIIPVELINF